MPEIADIVSVIESSVPTINTVQEIDPDKLPKTPSVAFVRQNTVKIDEVLFNEPTFSERCLRYLWVVLYLCGLCSLGFVLSVYHLFFWDSKMPPVYKPVIKKAIPVITIPKY